MDTQKELLELLNSISAEISSKFDGIHFEINSMKSAISTLNKKLEINSNAINSLSSSIDKLNKNNNDLLYNINSSSSISDKSYKEYENKLNSIQKELKNTNSNILSSQNISSAKLCSISEDLMFITHKILQSEKDLFKIQESIKREKKK